MEKSEKDNLVRELNELSVDPKKNKARMVEIAKILLADHYWFTRNNNSNGNIWRTEKKNSRGDKEEARV